MQTQTSEVGDAIESVAPTTLAAEMQAPSVSRAYQCQCGRPVFLRNSRCLACQTPLGYVVDRLGVVPLAPATGDGAEPDTFTVFGDAGGKAYRRCANLDTPAACNWMVPAPREGDDPDFNTHGLVNGLCLACSVTRTIPDLSIAGNGERWQKLEIAKRRLVSQLLALGLPVITQLADPMHGMSFDFLSNSPGGPRVLTGHDNGLITLNIEEAEDAVRERIRAEMREPYRTLVGHFRHEVGHYYWDLLVAPTAWIDSFRELFGDERADYATALQNHYQNGPPPDWVNRYVTNYASSHPWEDWAETWAHYLHMADTADTAMSFGVDAQNVELSGDLFEMSDLWQPDHADAADFLDFLNSWVRLTAVLNELSRSMGQPDFYPFVLPRAAVGKLQFVHMVIAEQRTRGGKLPAFVSRPAQASTDQVEPLPASGPAAPDAGDQVPMEDAPVSEVPAIVSETGEGELASQQQQQQPADGNGVSGEVGSMPSQGVSSQPSETRDPPRPAPQEQQFQ